MATDRELPEMTRLSDIPDPFADALASMAAPTPAEVASLPRSPSRATVRARRAAALGLTVTLVGAMLLAMRVRRDVAGELAAPFVLGLIGPLVAGVIALIVAVRAGRGALGTSARAQLVAALAVASSFVAAAALDARLSHAIEPPLGADLVCASISLAFAAAPLALALLALRRSFAVVTRLRAGLIGVAAGGLAAAALHAHCPYDGVVHVVAGHGFAMVAFGLLAAALARLLRA